MKVPNQLCEMDIRFNRMKPKDKIPIDLEWQLKNNFNETEIQEWIDKGNNYGVVCGDGLVVIDTDHPHSEKELSKILPETFTVKTKKGYHRYYFCHDVKSTKIPNGWGEVRSTGNCVVGPGCIHPSGAIYTIINNIPIKHIQREELAKLLNPYTNVKSKEVEDLELLSKPKSVGDRNDATFKLATFYKRANWNKEDVLFCLKEWNSRNEPPLTDKELINIVNSAFKGDGYNIYYKQDPTDYSKNEPVDDFKFDPIDYTELISKEVKEQNWLVDNLIPATGVTVLGGKRSSFKSWIAMDLALSSATGEKFLGKTKTLTRNVLYINSENDDALLIPRLKMLGYKCNGHEMTGRLKFLNFSSFKFDKAEWVEQLEAEILNNQIGLVICDPFAGTHSGDENDAQIIRGVFTDVIGRISNKYDVAFVLIHHLRKGMAGKQATDMMDELRGSSEFANYVSSIIITQRKNKEDTIILHHVKNRAGEECPAAQYEVVSDEETLTFEFKGYGDDTENEIKACLSAILDWSSGAEFTTKDVIQEIENKYSRSTITRALKMGVEDSSFDRIKRGHYLVNDAVLDAREQRKLSANS